MKKFLEVIRHTPMYLCRACCTIFLLYLRVKKRTPEGEKYRTHIKGGAILVANHTSFLDPIIMYANYWYRSTLFLAGEAVLNQPIKGTLLKEAGCVKIDREISDLESVEQCIAHLKNGKAIVMFPQGGVVRSGELNELKAGAILMAHKAGVPIIPSHIHKRKHWWQRQLVVTAEPFYTKDYCEKKYPKMSEMNRMTEALLSEMKRCEAYVEK